ncbi:hypothetical protein [Stigmatella erecta]|uniref:Uncharacterized protein n=1 Tax=Stigmatella erecta TaxID=83460 RepID=A0A1I0LDK4_9BACT|nr:hypothetical protein [Stigmatella erecta]SEU38242.1 hypothetical protein SAMN05443639_12637 [Stigmatella erecta]
MDPHRERIEPRPEARPLEFDELTEEQREAGKKASSLLRGMAHEPWNHRSSSRSQTHSYLPSLDDNRHNRVVLLDGARGSGKSALLLSLLNVYIKALTEQRVPQPFEAWIGPSDRVVPVGLIDLQPLPSSTHLILHLVASLERVVEAMESRPGQSRSGSAAWHPSNENELASRRGWRHFARVAASGWESNLPARQGALDPEAFAVEVEQGELQRLDVIAAFRDFVDALVDDYRAWNHWQQGPDPLFLLAIDDADMNPRLSRELLHLVRKLWHPRLAFLLTGDSDLFLDLPDPGPNPRGPGFVFARSIPKHLNLDLYSKVIPQLHRCRLSGLSPRQRLTAGPCLETFFHRCTVNSRTPLPGRSTGTLLDYFRNDPQILEALPGRIRPLWELAALIQSVSGSGTAKAVEQIWLESVRTAPNDSSSQRERLFSMVWVDSSTQALKIDPGFAVEYQLESKAEVTVDQWRTLHFEQPSRVTAFLGRKDGGGLDHQVTAALMVAANYAADTSGATTGSLGFAIPSGLSVPLLARASVALRGSIGPMIFPWPTPQWNSFLDIALLKAEWEREPSLSQPSESHLVESMAQHFLRTILRIGLGPQAGAGEEEQQLTPSWGVLASEIARAARMSSSPSYRQRAMAEWARFGAGLLAAPEYGLPAPAANAFLQALGEAFGDEWGTSRHVLRARREAQFRESSKDRFIKSGLSLTNTDPFHDLDAVFPEHRFKTRTQLTDRKQQKNKHDLLKQLRHKLENTRLPLLQHTIGKESNKDPSLMSYLSPLRWKWLEQASASFLADTTQELSHFTSVRDAGAAALESIWKAGCTAANAPEFEKDVQLIQGSLRIAAELRRQLDAHRDAVSIPSEGSPFGTQTGLSAQICPLSGAQSPILPLGSKPRSRRALEAVLRMAYDHEMDQSKDGHTTPPPWWKGIQLRFQGGPAFFPWPVPAWPTLFEWEVLQKNWNQQLHLVRKIGGEESTQPDSRIMDALAYWLVSLCYSLETRNVEDPDLRLSPSLADWKELTWRRRQQLLHGNPQRAAAYRKWRIQTALFATPEAGLSPLAASGILAALPKPSKEALEKIQGLTFFLARLANPDQELRIVVAEDNVQEIREELMPLRKERLLAAGIPDAQADQILTQIDQQFATHPWIQTFGPWEAPGKSPA